MGGWVYGVCVCGGVWLGRGACVCISGGGRDTHNAVLKVDGARVGLGQGGVFVCEGGGACQRLGCTAPASFTPDCVEQQPLRATLAAVAVLVYYL